MDTGKYIDLRPGRSYQDGLTITSYAVIRRSPHPDTAIIRERLSPCGNSVRHDMSVIAEE